MDILVKRDESLIFKKPHACIDTNKIPLNPPFSKKEDQTIITPLYERGLGGNFPR